MRLRQMINAVIPALVIICNSCSQVSPEPQSTKIVIPDNGNANIKGAVTCQNKGVEGVVISDGEVFTQTDKDGFFWLYSSKKTGCVFMSIPSGYMAECDGALPKFWHTLSGIKGVETAMFKLEKQDNENIDLVVSTDYHLADRYSSEDLNAFKTCFVSELKKYADSVPDRKVYNLVLGDMTWDIFWNQFNFTNYKTLARQLPVTTFHVLGNHDYDMTCTDDMLASKPYMTTMGPAWYSFNLGKNHIVVLDDIVYINKDQSRSHDSYVSKEILEWLKQDLSYVPEDRRIFVAMHCSAFRINGISSSGKPEVAMNFDPAYKEADFLECLKGREVHILTGDTHINWSMPPETIGISKYPDIYEHNIAAVCSSWWWTWYMSHNHICKDGSEGGFLVMSLGNKDLSWRYKSLSYGFDKQFHSYDMNSVKERFEKDPQFLAFLSANPGREDYSSIGPNVVLVNVWNWDPRWTVSVKENGKELPVKWKYIEDPLHTLSYDAPRTFLDGDLTSSFCTMRSHHIFMVTASSATSTLEIEVKDSFGNVSKETMTRPKAFTTDKE